MKKTYTVNVSLHSYIAHPYWPERERLINIVKESGMSRARSSANRRKALEEYLRSAGMTFAQYEELEERANRPFYTEDGVIVVPELHVMSMIVNTCMTIRAAGRPVPPEQARSALTVGSWRTDRTGPDGVWERFAVVTAGTGAKLSNQRALRSNPYIGTPPGELDGKNVPAVGMVALDDTMVKPSVLLDALRWAGSTIGIGASRKMGWGRFDVLSLD
jgi:hypothetical protein